LPLSAPLNVWSGISAPPQPTLSKTLVVPALFFT
jgi:hypothetical protein